MQMLSVLSCARGAVRRASVILAVAASTLALPVHAATEVVGDVDGDLFVSCQDTAAATAAVGKRSGQPGFVAAADIDRNGVIDVRDISAIARLLPTGTNCNAPTAAPVANAGADQTVSPGTTVQLSGAASSDPDGHALSYSWVLASKPAGSNANLSNAKAVNPTLVPDVVGSYDIRLQVFDGIKQSVADAVQVTAAHIVTFDPTLCALQAGAPYGETVGLVGTNVMVTSADVNASLAGCRILAKGGSAADAAIAVQAVLAVTEPFGSGLAGGSVVTFYDAALNKVRTFDGLAATPSTIGVATTVYQAAVADDLNCKAGLTLGASISAQQGNTNISGRAVGVPGTVKVLDLVHQQYGAKPWRELWDEAIGFATNGFPMTKYMYSTLYSAGTEFDEDTGLPLNAGGIPAWFNSAGTAWGAVRCKFTDIRARYCDLSDSTSQKPLAIGTTIRNAPLAATLATVRDGGAAAFYDPNGTIVAAILKRFRDDKFKADGTNNCFSTVPATASYANGTANPVPARIPSLMTAADFANYRAVERKPLVGTAFGHTIYTQPAPSFGGVAILYELGVLERRSVQNQAFNSLEFVHLATEASRLANADRRNIVGDPAYSNVNDRVNVLLSAGYLDSRAALIGSNAIGTVPQGTAAQGIPPFIATNPATFNPLSMREPARDRRYAQRKAMRIAQGEASRREEDWNTTSNIAIVDGYGNALAMTTTINTHWGAHIEAAGMLLNDALSNFSAGAVGSDVNGFAANKRPRTSISPSIAFDGAGKLRLVWGSAGGGPIPDYIVKTFLGNVVYGMDIQAAINADNWSGQDVNGTNPIAEVESIKPINGLIPQLMSTYHYTVDTLSPAGLDSGLSGISIQWGTSGLPTYRGGADNRRNGGASGY